MKRTKSQRIGELGENLVYSITEKQGDWIPRKLGKDYGIDLEIELVENEIVTGRILKVQVKAISKYEIIDARIKFSIKKDFLKYCSECRVPIILVLIDTKREIGFYLWVQEYLKRQNFDLNKGKYKTIQIDSVNDYEDGLNNHLKKIAKGLNLTQIQLDIKACLESAFLLGDEEVYEKMTDIFMGISKTYSLEIESAIDNLIKLGNKAWGTFEGNKKSKIAFNLCRKYGDKFTKSHIENLVMRGFTYSRTGIISLGILYDEYPKYISSLGLPKLFNSYDDKRIRYYCLLREKYLGMKGMEMWMNQKIDYEIEDFYLQDDMRETLYLKYPNRGESTILDYIESKEKKKTGYNNV